MANEFVARNGLIALDNSIITGSLEVTNGITGSLFGTSSWAVSASWAPGGTSTATGDKITSGSVTASVDIGTTTFRIISGSSTFLFVSSSGNVGINNTNPIHRLQIGTTGSVSSANPEKLSLGGTYSDTAGSNIKFRVYDDGSSFGGMNVSSGQTEVNTWSTGKLAFYRGTVQSMIIDATSNVGIGTAVPTSKFQVSGSSNVVNFRGSGSAATSSIFTVDGAAGRLFSVNDSLSGSLFSVNTIAGLPVMEAFSDNTVRIGQYGQRALYVSQSRVGINKETSLNANLDVSGSTTISGSLNVSGSITTTGTITATTLVVQTVTSSVSFITGSTKFGSLLTDTHQFTGSISITGSITGTPGVTNDLTASYALATAGGAAFPYTGSAQITGSLGVTGSISKSGGTSAQYLMADGSTLEDPSGAVVATSQTTTSATYTDLTTAGPAATVTIRSTGTAIVIVTAQAMTATSGVEAYMGFAVSGATTVAASDSQAMVSATRNTGDTPKQSAVFWVSGLTAGSNTFTAKYRSGTAGTVATFVDRNIIVIPT